MTNEIKNNILIALFGYIICIVLGFLLFGNDIFDFNHSESIIVRFGFYGAVFFSFLKNRKNKDILLIGILIIFINIVIIGKSITKVILIRDTLFIIGYLLGIYFYKLFQDKNKSLPLFVRSLALPLFLGILSVLTTLLLILIFNPSSFKINPAIFLNAKYSSIIGIGLGVGFDLFEKVKSRLTLLKVV